jgi:oligosaccharide repeat unit polymerase
MVDNLVLCGTVLATGFLISRVTSLMNFFHPGVFYYWYFLLFSYLSFLYKDVYEYALEIESWTLYMLTISIFSFSFGMVFSSNKRNLESLKVNIGELVEKSVTHVDVPYLIYLLSIMTAVGTAIYFSYTSNVFLWLSEDFDDLRMKIREGRGFITLLGINLSYIAIILGGILSYKKKKPILLIVSLLVCSASAITYGNRAPALEVISVGGVFLALMYLKTIKFRHFVVSFIALLTLLMIMQVIRQGLDFTLDSIIKQMLWRPFTNLQNLQLIFDDFPYKFDFYYGKTWLYDLSLFLPGTSENFGTHLKNLLELDFTGGSVTATLTGQSYIDFGLVGVIIISFVVGFLAQQIYLYFLDGKISLITLIISSLTFKSMVSSGVISPVLYIFIPCFLIYSSFKVANNIFRSIG